MRLSRRRRHLAALAALVVGLLWMVLLTTPVTARAATSATTPSVPNALPADLEPLAPYVPATSCDATAKPGTVALGQLLTATYPHTRYAITRTCGTDRLPTSEHYDGRALDWMNSVRDPRQAAQAQAVIDWLTATDSAGHPYANARRLGVMYVIWNDKIWGAYSADRGWRPYSTCAEHPQPSWDSTCHRDHLHVSLSWPGAMARTSWWTSTVAGPDYGPCRARDLNWAVPYVQVRRTPCPRYPQVQPPAGASPTVRTLTTYSGMKLRYGSTGPVVNAVQKVLGVRATGSYGTATKAAVRGYQSSHGLTGSGNVNTATWRVLLAELRAG